MAEKFAVNHYENNVDFIPDFVRGKYEIPLLYPEKFEPVEFIRFHEAKAISKCKNYGIHFFESDYHFQGIWTRREKYRHMFLRFGAVMTPDFSIYPDWPLMVQVWNHYRKHLIGAWMQDIGCKVYPTISWSDKRSFDFCFDGEPVNGTVCVSSVGTQRDKETKKNFIAGYEKMLEVLNPNTIIFYGNVPEECEGNIIRIETHNEIRRKRNHD